MIRKDNERISGRKPAPFGGTGEVTITCLLNNPEEMEGFYCVRNAVNRETFFDRSYMRPIGQQQIDDYKMRGYTLTQTVNW